MGVRPGYRLFCGLPAGDWTIPAEEYMDITWIVYKDFTAVAVNGKLVHYGENYPYMQLPDEKAAIRVGTTGEGNMTVKSLIISILE